jgi:hypothetical protein
MSRAVSIHIGVNAPQGRMSGQPLRRSEGFAWGMASLAAQAGYESMLVLRGAEATRRAVHDALTAAAGTMTHGDVLLVSFTGHGCLEADINRDERQPYDATWCLYDGEILDDRLAGYWRLFESGVRIIIVADGCHTGDCARGDEEEDEADKADKNDKADTSPTPPASRLRDGGGDIYLGSDVAPSASRLTRGGYDDYRDSEVAPFASRPTRGGGDVYRGSDGSSTGAADHSAPCIAASPHDADGIQASVLLLAAAGTDQKAQEGLFTEHLLELWNGGAFTGSFCELYREVRERVVTARNFRQEPQIQMFGSPDPGFPLERAFHLGRGSRGRGYW